ncbi:MAG: transglutaminase domain-containing protein, partial [Spirochaetaceae bacterium]|nr:transglutaminase domain-containing protein [Spirochaetaceae bacterium]
MNLLLSVLIIFLTVLSLAAVRRDEEIRISGTCPGKRGFSFGRILYGIIAAGALSVLLLLGNNLRREQSIQSGGGLLSSDMFRFDFSDVLSLEPEISLNGELTMLYREGGPAFVRYLRRYTLSGWDDKKGFFRDGDNESLLDASNIPITLPKSPRSWAEGDIAARVNLRQEYYLVALDPESFFALNYPVAVEPWIIWDDASFTRAYAVESRISVAGPWELMDSGESPSSRENRAYFLAGGDDPYFVDLAQSITAEFNDPWSKAAAVENWFHENYYYSLKPGLSPDGDQLRWFLKESRRGYCSYFAFAMTRICRAAGIPARVAVGFLTDPETSTLGFVPVRSDQAHAWVEVWFDEFGWISFDPTSDVMAPGEEYPF